MPASSTVIRLDAGPLAAWVRLALPDGREVLQGKAVALVRDGLCPFHQVKLSGDGWCGSCSREQGLAIGYRVKGTEGPTEAQREGRACIRCGREDAPRMVPIGYLVEEPRRRVFECDPPCMPPFLAAPVDRRGRFGREGGG